MSNRPMAGRITALAAVVGIWTASGVAPAEATIVRGFSLGSMTVAAQSIVRGTIIEQEVLYDARWGRVYTHSYIEVSASTWGIERPGDIIVVRQIGGELDGITTAVVGTAHLRLGDDVVVYARTDGDLHYLVGMSQGVYHVDSSQAEPVVARGVDAMNGLGFLPAIGPVQRRAANRMTLRALMTGTEQTLRDIGRLP